MDVTFEQLLALRATDGVSPAVDIRLPLLQVGNRERQERVSEMLERLGSWERLQALPGAASEIPAKPGLYMFVWCPPLWFRLDDPMRVSKSPATNSFFVTRYIVYIGQAGADGGSGTLQSRYKSDYAKVLDQAPVESLFSRKPALSREEKLRRYLSLKPLEYWFLVPKEATLLSAFERSLQEFVNPPGIVQNRAVLYPVATTKAF